ncbi:unnamed protein product [Pylaiella littoralis]
MDDTPSPSMYDAIGVGADASTDRIRKATRRMVNEVRASDKRNSEKNELIRFFKRAREVLTDPRAREDYDRSIGIETVGHVGRDTSRTGNTSSLVPVDRALGAPLVAPLGDPLGDPLGAPLVPLGPFTIHHPFATPSSSSSSSSSSRALAADPFPSLMGILGPSFQEMFCNDSIVPDELGGRSRPGGLVPGTFHVLEYTKVRNADGGFDEFGFTREGDMKKDRVTEKRFERKT